MSTHQRPGSPGTDLREQLRDELREVVAATPAPTPTSTVRGARTRARTIRARRRAVVAGSVVAVAAAVVAVVPGALSNRSTPTPTDGVPPEPAPTQTVESLPRFDGSAPCSFSALVCRVPQAVVVDGRTRLTASNIGSKRSDTAEARVGIQVVSGSGEYAVAAGNVALLGVRPSAVVVHVDGIPVGRFEGGAMHIVEVPRGRHWVRVDLDGPPTPRSALAVAHYEAP